MLKPIFDCDNSTLDGLKNMFDGKNKTNIYI